MLAEPSAVEWGDEQVALLVALMVACLDVAKVAWKGAEVVAWTVGWKALASVSIMVV